MTRVRLKKIRGWILRLVAIYFALSTIVIGIQLAHNLIIFFGSGFANSTTVFGAFLAVLFSVSILFFSWRQSNKDLY